ncbi:neprilysin-2-like [Venturia canescens]|uniref:neprilysin-2-like n=1 Tax=Venturia canescens TaxID=32260 RepID=UPI001C9CFB16|nr:neprilysin-2-like [Venturia canescens]
MCQTPKRVQANYAMWRIVEDSLYYLNEEVLRRELAFSAAIGGRKKRPPRWNHCIQLVLETFPILVGSLYVRNYFDKETKANAAAMAADVKEHFIRILETVEWMDEKTRNHSVEVANAMSAYIAYPDELLDDEELEKLWPDFDLSEDYFFENIYHLAAYGRNKRFSKLREPIDEKDWKYRVNPTIVNAFYNSALNSFHLPAGILQGDFFNNDRPKYMNYGGIGTIIGHEIAHGFGEIGWQFDENGNKLDWWEPSNKENYLKRTSCIVDQYANQTVQEVNLKLNGTKTQKENMADNRGIKAAYMAYNDWAEVNGPEPQLPGIDRTPQQMFWISIATSSCSVSTPESMKFQIDHNFHSPEEFRVLVPLWNSLEFAKDFKCPVGSKMNPKKKCSVW